MKLLLLFLLFLVNYSTALYCGFPIGENQTTTPFNRYVTIKSCSKDYEHPGNDYCEVLFEGEMEMGDYITHGYNNNTFQYMGDGSVCYSVYRELSQCYFLNPQSGCARYCVYNYTSFLYYNVYGYYTCDSKQQYLYTISITENSHEGNPSSSNRIMYSMFSLLLVFIVGLLI
ncbi:hypothetical protein DICPUDRAFT_77375 [Dictyostelium purpureum]|uniref:Uncharacterized protein n=1 Tax=Dictyostelium purpureum TaxID=5786 RepID=F0ZGF3_DICPU|nr:uncharacterized protein DICPUDRAFT_77375 [Dictyostelium purpureum]EGC37002.1 hypothetical protein DICPUDRAFT_77375 [Dictyostelium purpureum]|eukprot:XP_003286499.1 hypothetical protein DICPUDRAFT_77375 [Dictyostelium purpureum]